MHQIGVGVLGPVFRTYEPSEDRLVAVKAFHLDITPEQAETLVDALARLVEADLSHPGIAAPIDVGFEDGVPYLAQEYVAAESLDVAMRHYAPAPVETAMPFIQQIGEAIDSAHAQGIVHGALHLRDIFVTPEEVRLTGFGVVKALEEIRLAGPIRRPYTAPEVIAGRGWGGEADLFALAAVAYELLTGRRAAGTGEQVTERLHAVPDVADSEALQAVFAAALSDSPENRFTSAARFSSSLDAAIGQEGSGAARIVAPGAASMSAGSSDDLLAGLELHREDGAQAASEVGEGGDGVFPGRSGATDLAARDAETGDAPADELEAEPEVWRGREEVVSRRDLPDADDDVDDGNVDVDIDDNGPDESPILVTDEGDVDQRTEVVAEGEFESSFEATPAEPVAAGWDADTSDTDTSDDDDIGYSQDAGATHTLDPDDDGEGTGLADPDDDGGDTTTDDFDTRARVGVGDYQTDSTEFEEARWQTDSDDDHGVTDDLDATDDGYAKRGVYALPLTRRPAWMSRGTLPLVGLALAIGALTYFVGVGLGTDSEPTDQVLGDEVVTEEAGREFSEEVVSDGDLAVSAVPPARSTPPPPIPAPVEPAETVADPTPTPGAQPAPAARPAPVARTVPTPRATPPAPSPTVPPPPAAAATSPQPAVPPVQGSGWLLVRTAPPGALVSVDGVRRGQTPLSLDDVSYGDHRVEITLSGFSPLNETVVVSPTDSVATLDVSLIPGDAQPPPSAAPPLGALVVESRPAGARVVVDGELVGTTPAQLEIGVGEHSVSLEIDGYREWSTTVMVTGAERARVAASLDRNPR